MTAFCRPESSYQYNEAAESAIKGSADFAASAAQTATQKTCPAQLCKAGRNIISKYKGHNRLSPCARRHISKRQNY